MKNRRFLTACVTLAKTILVVPCLLAQGDLTPPPGPPAPVMKTLEQVEPRTIVNATNTPGDATNTYIISLPGSYYLTSNLAGDSAKHGISIQASDVTLDLNGFTLTNVAGLGSVRGVNVPMAQKNICVRNGTVRLWNDGGVQAEMASNAVVEKVRALDGGSAGIRVGIGSLIKDCVANANLIGIQTADRCQVMNCVSTENLFHGFYCAAYNTLIDCTSSRNSNDGIVVLGGSSVLRCSATRNIPSGKGIFANGVGCTISACTASQNGSYGIEAGSGSSIISCTSSSNSVGIKTDGECTIKDCSVAYNSSDGISTDKSSIANCAASYNGLRGIFASGASLVSNSSAHNNADIGISGNEGSIIGCVARENGQGGIAAGRCAVSGCTAVNNQGSGIGGVYLSVMNCTATDNHGDGIAVFNGVISFCYAAFNNQSNNGSVDIDATGVVSRTSNLPAP